MQSYDPPGKIRAIVDLITSLVNKPDPVGSRTNPATAQPVYANRPVPQWLKDVAFSPFIQDTASAVLGFTPNMRYSPHRASEAAGFVQQNKPQEVHFTSDMSGGATIDGTRFNDYDQVLQHELGHSFQFGSGGNKDKDDLVKEVNKNILKMKMEEITKYPEWERWLYENEEHFADAFDNAWSLVRLFNTQDHNRSKKEFWSYVEEGNKQVPGTKEIVQYLLKQPIYKDHKFADEQQKK